MDKAAPKHPKSLCLAPRDGSRRGAVRMDAIRVPAPSTHRHGVSGDVVLLAVLDHLLQVWAVVRLSICDYNHYSLCPFPATFLKRFRAAIEEMPWAAQHRRRGRGSPRALARVPEVSHSALHALRWDTSPSGQVTKHRGGIKGLRAHREVQWGAGCSGNALGLCKRVFSSSGAGFLQRASFNSAGCTKSGIWVRLR